MTEGFMDRVRSAGRGLLGTWVKIPAFETVELLAHAGRYFDLYTRQAGLEANRFINPGEKEPEPDVEGSSKRKDGREGLGEVARDLLGFTGRSRN